MPEQCGEAAQYEHDGGQPLRGPAQEGEEAPQAVEPGVDGQASHGRSYRARGGRVPARHPDLERGQADLGPKAEDDQGVGGVMQPAAVQSGPRRETERAGRAGQQQEPDQQGAPTGLADRRGGPGGSGLVPAPPSGGAQDIERHGQGFPGEEEGEGVGGGDRDRDRGQEQHVPRSDGTETGPPTWRGPAHQGQGNDGAEAARKGQEEPGQRV